MVVKIVTNQITLASIGIALLLVAGFIANLFLAKAAIYNANHNWCVVLQELTKEKPPHETANAVQFYNNLNHLEFRFGCQH